MTISVEMCRAVRLSGPCGSCRQACQANWTRNRGGGLANNYRLIRDVIVGPICNSYGTLAAIQWAEINIRPSVVHQIWIGIIFKAETKIVISFAELGKSILIEAIVPYSSVAVYRRAILGWTHPCARCQGRTNLKPRRKGVCSFVGAARADYASSVVVAI